MTSNSNSEADIKILNKINPYQWQIEMLSFNSPIIWPGPGTYDMSYEKVLNYNTWDEFKKIWFQDEYNEFINFHFKLYRSKCNSCFGEGYTEHYIDDLEYWHFNITQKSLEYMVSIGDVLTVSHGRVIYNLEKNAYTLFAGTDKSKIKSEDLVYPNLKDVNFEMNNKSEEFTWLTPFNDWKAHYIQHIYAERNLPFICPSCDGGFIYSEEPYLSLCLWVIQPGHSASSGVNIKEVKKYDLLNVMKFLIDSKEAHAKKFSNVNDEIMSKLISINNNETKWNNNI